MTQVNGIERMPESLNNLHVGKKRMKLSKGGMTIAKEFYSNSMQVLMESSLPSFRVRIFSECDELHLHILKIFGCLSWTFCFQFRVSP